MHDIAIIGAGPAGLTAAIYAARAGKKVLVIEKAVAGGKITETPFVDNIPGFKGSGAEFGLELFNQAESYGIDFEIDDIKEIKYVNDTYVAIAGESDVYQAKTCIIATGTKNRTLGLNEEDVKMGLHFCATCDGPFYQNRKVIVVGGGNSAVTEAIELAEIAKSVTIVQNLPHLTAEQSLLNQLNTLKNVEVKLNCQIQRYGVNNDGMFNYLSIVRDGNEESIIADGIFLAVGLIPQNDNFKNVVYLDNNGFISDVKAPNIFACGDCTDEKIKQVVIATADGARAALAAVDYLTLRE